MKYIILIIVLVLFAQSASAEGRFKFDLATQVAGVDNYTRHWSGVYPPDPKADIVVYSAASNLSYKRMSALSFLYVVYDPRDNIVALQKIDSFKRNYEDNVVYYTLHPGHDWMEGNYKVKIVVYDKIDRDAYDEQIAEDPFGIGFDFEKYKKFYETGGNAEDLGVVLARGNPVAQAVLNFKIDRSVTMYPPDRFVLHDVRFPDNNTERILGEKLQIEVELDNNYKDDGTVKLAMLVDNNLVSTQDVAVKGFGTSKVVFDAKAGKLGTFKLSFGADTPDVKFRNAELKFTIKNETDTTRLDTPKITITGMNVDKEFVSPGEELTVLVNALNNGKTGNKTITVYSNGQPVGSSDIELKYLEEKTVEIPVKLKKMGINKVTVSDAPQLFRNVFVQEGEASSMEDNLIVKRVGDNPLKVSMVMVFLVFAGTLYYMRNKLKDEELPVDTPVETGTDPLKTGLSDLKEKIDRQLKKIMKKKSRP